MNRREPGYKTMMEDGLEEICKSLKDLVHGKKIRNFTVMFPLQLFPNNSDCEEEQEKIVFWGTDPVHLTAEGYDELVKALAEAAVSGTYERAATAPADVTTNIPRKKSSLKSTRESMGVRRRHNSAQNLPERWSRWTRTLPQPLPRTATGPWARRHKIHPWTRQRSRKQILAVLITSIVFF
jgi:hypothetical protein